MINKMTDKEKAIEIIRRWPIRPDLVDEVVKLLNSNRDKPKLIVRLTGHAADPPLGYLYRNASNEYALKSVEVKDRCIPVRSGDLIVIE